MKRVGILRRLGGAVGALARVGYGFVSRVSLCMHTYVFRYGVHDDTS